MRRTLRCEKSRLPTRTLATREPAVSTGLEKASRERMARATQLLENLRVISPPMSPSRDERREPERLSRAQPPPADALAAAAAAAVPGPANSSVR